MHAYALYLRLTALTGALMVVDTPDTPTVRPGAAPFLAPAPGSPHTVGPMAGRPAIGDCNHDGNLDLVVACGACCGAAHDPRSGHLMVLLGDGRGRFRPAGPPIPIGP